MGLKVLNCEEEAIHLIGRIQDFGYLIVFDFSQQCIALSENCSDWLLISPSDAIHKPIDFFLKAIDCNYDINISISSLLHQPITFTTKIGNQNYQLTIYINNEQIFFEFEIKEGQNIDLQQLNDFQLRFDHNKDIWQTLCQNIYNIVDFDRIMIYQFLEDSSGIVIAENVKDTIESLLGYRYPAFDIPAQARALYLKNLSRQTSNIFADTIPIIGLPAVEIDLTKSQIRALSPIHLQYLANFGVQASASFSIIIDNKLWGLVACQNLMPKYIPFDQKNLSLFITQYAANKFVVREQQKALDYINNTKEIELELKEKLFYNHSLENTLSEFANRFTEILKSEGMIIKTPDSILRFGNTPEYEIFNNLHDEINQQLSQEEAKDNSIYTSHAFSFNHTSSNEPILWPGIARINLDKDYKYCVYWFRKEIYIAEKWAGNPQKNKEYSIEQSAYIYSPRLSFETWMTEVKGNSEKWTRLEEEFLKRIQKLIHDSIINKMGEIKLLNEKLIEINNKLGVFSHQLGHDIKNPLTTIKTSTQLIQLRRDLNKELINKFSSNILEAVDLINNIIDKTIDSTKPSDNVFTFERIFTDGIINQIIHQAIENYKIQNFKVELGELHPVLGDKTLLYQLFMNLINNAIKFSSKQELTTLEVYSKLEGNNTVYFIKDNGIGIKEEEKSRMFNIFQRLSNANEFDGTGVGMSIVKRIIDKLNAQIFIDSQIGSGTQFKIIFPKI